MIFIDSIACILYNITKYNVNKDLYYYHVHFRSQICVEFTTSSLEQYSSSSRLVKLRFANCKMKIFFV